MNKLDKVLEENNDVWKNKSAFMNFLRGGLRKSLWSRHPVKLKLIKEKRQRIPNPNPKGKVAEVWGAECEVCHNPFVQKELQVDHIRDDYNKLNEIEDIQQFVESLSIVTSDELRLVCKGCHGIISHAQRKGISFEQAKVEKEIIHICKDDKKMIDKLCSFGILEQDIPKTKISRKRLITKLMKGEEDD